MRDYKLTKQAAKKLKFLIKNDLKTAEKLKAVIMKLRHDLISGESLQGHSEFKKVRVGKFRLIYAYQEQLLLIAIIDKREIVYQVFDHAIKNSNFLEL